MSDEGPRGSPEAPEKHLEETSQMDLGASMSQPNGSGGPSSDISEHNALS